MKFVLIALLLGVVALVSAPSIVGEAEVVACAKGLGPVHAVPPSLPPRLHNEFEGMAQVDYIVDVDGRVQVPRIVLATWKPIGRSRGQPVGYAEAILSAVGQWRFAAQARPCRNRSPVEIAFK